MIEAAKHRIYISGWAFAPELFLSRGPNGHRIDYMLEEKAKQGRKFFLLNIKREFHFYFKG